MIEVERAGGRHVGDKRKLFPQLWSPPPLEGDLLRIWDSSTKVPNYVYPLSPEGPEALTWDGYILAVSGSSVTNIVSFSHLLLIQPFVTVTNTKIGKL